METNRPRFHFTPPLNWMNDPNGLVYHDGEYHLFYQHNPYGKAWGHMSWGHAVSPDLLHWRHLPTAILEEPQRGYTIFSGSAVIDHHNTSGLGQPGAAPMVAIYTADYHPDRDLEDIHIAYSLDKGRTFNQYAGNPVISVKNGKFGDPKVFWHDPSHKWILVAIHGAQQGWCDFYRSDNLRDWQLLSSFHAPRSVPGIWECPDLFPVKVLDPGSASPEAWVLKVNSVTPHQGLGITRYFVGEFDGREFRADPDAPQTVNPDRDVLYAEATYNDAPDGRTLLLGWIRQSPSDDRAWTGMQSIPRQLILRRVNDRLRLCHETVAELGSLHGARHSVTRRDLTGDLAILSDREMGNGAWEVGARFDPGAAAECGVLIRLAHAAVARVGFSSVTRELFVDPPGQARLALSMDVASGPVELRLFVDRGVVEVFGGQGQATITAPLEPETACTGLGAFALEGTARQVEMHLWELETEPPAGWQPAGG